MPQPDTSLLHAALIGYEAQIKQLQAEMAGVQKQLGKSASRGSPGRHTLSAAARKRIAMAQKKRWAAFHKQKARTK